MFRIKGTCSGKEDALSIGTTRHSMSKSIKSVILSLNRGPLPIAIVYQPLPICFCGHSPTDSPYIGCSISK